MNKIWLRKYLKIFHAGFLSLSDPELNVPGNAGLKDQVLALRWIHENICNFNGDPNNITLMGMSAGAASTQIMMTTEQTRGLFHKAIIMSGSSLCGWPMSPIAIGPIGLPVNSATQEPTMRRRSFDFYSVLRLKKLPVAITY